MSGWKPWPSYEGRVVNVERLKGLEPLSSAWQTEAQPLYQRRKLVQRARIELATIGFSNRHSTY